jgi:hypothetical protein
VALSTINQIKSNVLKEILIGTTGSGISSQLRDIYSICRCRCNVAANKWKVHNWKIEIMSFVIRSVLMVEEAGVPGKNHRPWASNW